jgi:hypothetical protein
MCAHYDRAPRAAKCVCATSSQDAASTGASHSRANIALGNAARSDRRCARWSTQACRIHGLPAPAPTGLGVVPICHEPASGGALRSLAGDAVLPRRASDTIRPTAGPSGCPHLRSVQSLLWIRPASSEQRPQIGAPPTFLHRGAYSLVGVASSIPSWLERFFHPSLLC